MSGVLGGLLASFKPAAGGAFESIATVTLAADSASVVFSSIPNTFSHLELRFIARGNRAATVSTLRATLNGDSGTNYAQHGLIGDGATASALASTASTSFDMAKVAGATATSGTFGAGIVTIHDYASTTKNKTVRSLAGVDLNGTGELQLRSALWMNTAAVSTITIVNQTSNILAGSTFALYGIKGA